MLGGLLREALTSAVMAQARKQSPDGADDAALNARLESMIARMTSQSAVTAAVGKNPLIYNLFTAPALKPGEPVRYEDVMPSPFSEDRIPTIGVFELVSEDAKAGTVTIHWQQDVDPDKGTEVMWKIVEALVGPMPGVMREGLPKEILLKDEATVILDRATGVPQRLDYVRRIELGGSKRTSTWSFVLKKG